MGVGWICWEVGPWRETIHAVFEYILKSNVADSLLFILSMGTNLFNTCFTYMQET